MRVRLLAQDLPISPTLLVRWWRMKEIVFPFKAAGKMEMANPFGLEPLAVAGRRRGSAEAQITA